MIMFFINFSDHGATGLVAFPSEELYADQLINTFKQMHEKKQYNQLAFYLEACESGSMFNGILPKDNKIYASSAANPDESSWATYCGADAVVNGVDLQTCLGDEYSVTWMEDSDNEVATETITEQFANVKGKVKGSHPTEYGDRTFESELITDFQGTTDSTTGPQLFKKFKNLFGSAKAKKDSKRTTWPRHRKELQN